MEGVLNLFLLIMVIISVHLLGAMFQAWARGLSRREDCSVAAYYFRKLLSKYNKPT